MNMQEEYLLTTEEFAVLLAGTGADKLYGLKWDLPEDFGRETTVHALHGLYQQALLNASESEEAFVVEPGLKWTLSIIAGAHKILRIVAADKNPLCCYCAQTALAFVTPDDAKPNGWRIWSDAPYTLFAQLKDSGYLPECDEELQQLRAELPETEEEMQEAAEMVIEFTGLNQGEERLQLRVGITRSGLYVLTDWLGMEPYFEVSVQRALNEFIREEPQ